MKVASVAVALGLLAAACHGSTPVEAPPKAASRPPPPPKRLSGEPPALHASELGRVPSVTYGPYIGMREDGGLVVWAAKNGGTARQRRFEVIALSGRGEPLAKVASAGMAPEEIGLVAVRPWGAGYAIVHTRRSAAGEVLEALCVNARGVPLAEPSVLGNLAGRALWIEAVPSASGALVFYAVRERDKRRAEVYAQPIDDKCHGANKTLVVKDAQAWQVQKLGSRALLATVRAAEGPGGSVAAFSLDASGKIEATTTVSAEASADLDLDAVAVGDRVVVGWTNRRALDPRVETAVLDGAGKVVRAPERLTAPDGEQALIRLVPALAAGGQAFVAWEKLGARPEGRRRMALSRLSVDGRAEGPRAELEFASPDGGSPEFQAGPRGLLALTLAPLCRRSRSCADADITPTYVELDEGMQLVAAEPLRLDALGGSAAQLGFGMGCTKQGCFALAALADVPAPVFATMLEARSNAWRPPLYQSPSAPPLVLEHETVAMADSVAALALQSSAGKDYLGYITDFDPTTPWKRLTRPASDGRLEPLRARVALERLSAGPRPTETVPASPISLRAESLGGVSVTHGDPARDELLVAWAGLDAGTPQVFLTLLGKGGAKVSQRMLTHKKGDLGDVAVAWVGDGWLLAWVDERHGAPSVYAAKVDAKLNRTSPEQRISNPDAVVSDLALAYDGKVARAVWADARSTETPGRSDIYTALVRPRDATREGDELVVASTRAHSFGPDLRPFQNGFVVAWLERGEAGEAGHIALAALPAGDAPTLMQPLAVSGEPRAVALDCGDASCRLAALVHDQEVVYLVATRFDGLATPPPAANTLFALAGAAAAAVRPVFHGDDVFFTDASGSGARIRRARVKW